MKIILVQEHTPSESAIIYYDVDRVVMFAEVHYLVMADFLGIPDARLEHVEAYAEQYLQDEIKYHEKCLFTDDIISNQPEVAHLFKPYSVVEGNFKKIKKAA